MSDCEHTAFVGTVELETTEQPGTYRAMISIACRDCGMPFAFRGITRLADAVGPVLSDDGCTLAVTARAGLCCCVAPAEARAELHAIRLTNTHGDVVAYTTDIRIRCGDCRAALDFQGLPAGSSSVQPMISADGFELRAPIVPSPRAVLVDGVWELKPPPKFSATGRRLTERHRAHSPQ